MFITDELFKSPLSKYVDNQAQTYWTSIELGLNISWFLVKFRSHTQPDDGPPIDSFRTLLMLDLSSLESSLTPRSDSKLQVESVQMVSPITGDGMTPWRIDALAAVWSAEDASAPGQLVDVYVTTNGADLTHSMVETPINALTKKKLRMSFLMND